MISSDTAGRANTLLGPVDILVIKVPRGNIVYCIILCCILFEFSIVMCCIALHTNASIYVNQRTDHISLFLQITHSQPPDEIENPSQN